MGRTASYDWPELFKQFHASGLNQSQFCKQHKLNPKYFSKKLADYTDHDSTTAFVRATIKPPAQVGSQDCLSLKATNFTLEIPIQTDPRYVASLLKGLL